MNPKVIMKTTAGDLTIELFENEAPVTVKNFLDYVDSGFYVDTVMHRVIPGFVIQGGGMTADLKSKDTLPPIQNEADNGLKNTRGSLSMARTADVNSATSQFFINLADNAFLDHGSRDFGYAVFAKITEGMDVIDTVAKVSTANRSFHENVPVEPITVTDVTRVEL